mgnify:CR=1 FL=1
MKKITLSLLTVLFTGTLMAQLPANEFFRYEFTGGSNANTSNTTATDLVGSFTSVTDRNSSAGDAASVTNLISGSNLSSGNINNTTLSFWIKTPTITATQRVVQMYGLSGNGYRVEIDGTNLSINARAESLSGFLGDAASDAVNLDDNQWHNIIIKTEYVGNASIDFDVYVDGVALPNTSALSIDPPGSNITIFLFDANFRIDPLGGSYGGEIDDIYLYQSALTNAEITQLANYYPAPPPTRYYVDEDATGNNDGTSWADAYTDLRDAFVNSFDGMEIWVAEGTYSRSGTDRNLTFGWTADSLQVYGGFNGTETMLSQRDWRVNETILSGDIGVVGSNSDNCYTTLVGPVGTASTVINYSLIDGLIIQDGNSNGSNIDITRYGGGFFSTDYVAQTDIKNCTFTNNNALYGAVSASTYATDKTVRLENCIFKDNTATSAAAVHSRAYNGFDLTTHLVNCLFVNNEANSEVSGNNQSTLFYFGVNGSATLNIDVVNSTISNNTNLYSGANDVGMTLIYAEQPTSTKNITMKNNIIWNNVNDDVLYIRHSSGNNFTALNHENSISDLSSSLTNYTATNVLNNDPLFTNPANEGFTLQNGSPAIDAGLQAGLSLPSLDLAGNPRIDGAEVDMGCYEFACPQFTFQITENNGVLSAPTNFATYQWSFGGNDIAGATSATYTPTQSGLYTVEVSDGSCPKTKTYFFCSTDLLTLFENNGVLTAPSGFDGYEWFLDGVLITGANNAVYATTQDGAYYCEATTIVPNSISMCTQTTATVSICSSVSVDITESNGTLTATPGYSDYQWFKDGVAISGAQNDTYTATESGDYFCEATENGCTSSSNMITIDLGTGINDIAFTRVNIYPNPTNGVFTISSSESIELVEVFNQVGQKVANFGHVNTIDISNLSNGVYTIKATSNAKIGVARLIKQ